MNLKNFESEVESKIVGRGLDYYKSGEVKKLEKVGENEFSATVFGTEKYSIYVKLNGEAIAEHECDCPYDYGNVCKHKVAVFYGIRNGNFSDTSSKLNALLANMHESALRKFVSNLLKKDQSFRREFLREFDEDFEEDDEDEFDEDYY
ncbi:MAG: SWIM zinc finger family protein [Acidobacteriota bacterium]|nr:SWIM zinc finger family protein [Acidobacteriota bacterium]